MHATRWWPSCFVFVLVVPTIAQGIPVQTQVDLDPNSVQALLERVDMHVAQNKWQRDGFADKTLESWLQTLVDRVKQATKQDEMALPVRLADVKTNGGVNPLRRGTLIIDKEIKVAHAEDSIFLSSGNIKVSFASNCILVARGVVDVAHGGGNLIIAGEYAAVSHDGNGIRGKRPSLIISRGSLHVPHAHGSILFAPHSLDVSHATGAIFLNRPIPQQANRGNNKSVTVQNWTIESSLTHPLSKRIEIRGFIRPTGVVLTFEGKRYVAFLDTEIMNEEDKPVAKLANWRLVYAENEMAVFSNGTDYALVPATVR